MIDPSAFEFAMRHDQVRCFLDPAYSAVMTKAVAVGERPVGLTAGETRRFAEALLMLADRLEAAEFDDDDEPSGSNDWDEDADLWENQGHPLTVHWLRRLLVRVPNLPIKVLLYDGTSELRELFPSS